MTHKTLDTLMNPEDMHRITRQEFCDNMDELLERVSNEDIAFIITEDGKDDLVLCPARWFGLGWDADLSFTVKAALRSALKDNEEAEAVARVIYKNIWHIDTDTLQEMRDILDTADTPTLQQLNDELRSELQFRRDGSI